MADFTESLTIRIRGDSSDFSQTIEGVNQKLSELDNRLASVESSGRRIEGMFSRWQQAATPLNRISTVLNRIGEQIGRISITPLRINVQPAMQSLQALQGQIFSLMAQLRSLNGMSVGGPGGGGVGSPAGFYHGGIVGGRPGLDRIPAMLTSGEFVIREPAVNQLGVQFLSALNERGNIPASRGRSVDSSHASAPASTRIYNFGGIHIELNRGNDLPEILRELQAGGVRLKNQRG